MWTKEQKDIATTPLPDLTLIQAYAGTGKTTTLQLIAENQPRTTKILYICFGKENQLEMEKRMSHLSNVSCSTFDGLCYRHFQETRSPGALNKWTISSEMKIPSEQAETVNQAMKCFMRDETGKVDDPPFRLWRMLKNGSCSFTNFEYLRKRFLEEVAREKGWRLGYDVILVDECQDLNGVMLECLLRFQGAKVFVGDRFQHIFGFMGMTDSFRRIEEIPNVKQWKLSKSFRFGQEIADFASTIADWVSSYPINKIQGTEERNPGQVVMYKRDSEPVGKRTILAVKNQTLMRMAFEASEENRSLYWIGKDYFFQMLEEEYEKYLKEGATETQRKLNAAQWREDMEKMSVYSTILSYGKYLPEKLNKLRKCHVSSIEEADNVYCTIHRSKGLEFDCVQLVDDLVVGSRGKEKSAKELFESIDEKKRMYYVGVTRAKWKVWVPISLVNEFSVSRVSKDYSGRMKFLASTKVIQI